MTTNFYDVTKPPIVGQSGPLILDGKLDPVWFEPVPVTDVANNLEAQRYHGQPVLTYWQGQVTATGLINSGTDVILNQHYQPIAHITGQDGWTITMHEIVVRGEDLWATVNKNVPHDLSGNGGVDNGVIVDSGVQEINIKTGRVVSTWDALKHIPPGDSRVQPPSNGFPWDAYHINSVSLQPHGRMLVSMRDTSALYLVDDKTGAVIWTLGGKHSDFAIPEADHFAWQHDAQLHPGGVVTMFNDNCCDITGAGVYLAPDGPTEGLSLKLNMANHTATADGPAFHLGSTVHAEYMGNFERLTGGGAFVGFGEQPFLSLFNQKGALIFDGAFPSPDIAYRSYLQKWVGTPLTKPRAVAAGNGVAVSWNGATQVTTWRVVNSSGKTIASRERDGFETTIPLGGASAGGMAVQALSASGKVLGTSKPIGGGS